LRRLPLIRLIRSARGQSLVEITILLPALPIMISGLIEFGFMLNYYLDLIEPCGRRYPRWSRHPSQAYRSPGRPLWDWHKS